MFDNSLHLDEVELERHMNDNASRVQMICSMQKRHSNLQKLITKAQLLSDKDFENACLTFESILDSFNKKSMTTTSKDDAVPAKLKSIIASEKLNS